jgi:hypothetical protein
MPMKRARYDAFVGGLTVVILTLSMSPGFSQDVGDIDESLSERFSSAGQSGDGDSSVPESSSQDIEIGRNVRVNRAQILPAAGLLGRSETTIASDEDGERIVVGFNNAQGFCGEPFGRACTPGNPPGLSGFGFSTDGGRSFTDGSAPPVIDHVYTRGDPWLDRGGRDRRTFFYANLAVDDRAIFPGGTRTLVDLGVSVHRGHFRDDSFVWEDVRVFNAPNAPDDFYDKEAIAVDKRGKGLGVVSLTNFIKRCNDPQGGLGQIEVWRTSNGGNTWQGPVVVSPDQSQTCNATGIGVRTGILQQSSAPVVGPDGEVFVAWQFGPSFTPATSTNAEIRVARSLDGGTTFDPPVVVARINTMRNNPPVGYNRDRINDHPRIAFVTEGRLKGRVFVAYYSAVAPVTLAPRAPCSPPQPPPAPPPPLCREQCLTSSQVFITFSDDVGLTWSSPTPLAAEPPPTGLKRWWPVVTADSHGTVAVVYYESQEVTVQTNPICTVKFNRTGTLRRMGQANSLVNTYVAISEDGGLSFGTPVRVSTATSNWCTSQWNVFPNFGDYIGSVRAQDQVLATWADSRNGPVDTFFSPVGLEGR